MPLIIDFDGNNRFGMLMNLIDTVDDQVKMYRVNTDSNINVGSEKNENRGILFDINLFYESVFDTVMDDGNSSDKSKLVVNNIDSDT